MEIVWYERLASTQHFLVDQLKKGVVVPPLAVGAHSQFSGIGSRENGWDGGEGNLFLSFALKSSSLPPDLPLASYSIYFATLFQMTLASWGSCVWVKWPNDLYCQEKKVGGVITTVFSNNVVCGIGCNLVTAPSYAGVLDITIDKQKLTNSYFEQLELAPSWKEVFSIFSVQFQKSQSWTVHTQEGLVSMEDATLCKDGSIVINSQRMTSNR